MGRRSIWLILAGWNIMWFNQQMAGEFCFIDSVIVISHAIFVTVRSYTYDWQIEIVTEKHGWIYLGCQVNSVNANYISYFVVPWVWEYLVRLYSGTDEVAMTDHNMPCRLRPNITLRHLQQLHPFHSIVFQVLLHVGWIHPSLPVFRPVLYHVITGKLRSDISVVTFSTFFGPLKFKWNVGHL